MSRGHRGTFSVPTDFLIFFYTELRGNNLIYMSRFMYRFEMLTGSKALSTIMIIFFFQICRTKLQLSNSTGTTKNVIIHSFKDRRVAKTWSTFLCVKICEFWSLLSLCVFRALTNWLYSQGISALSPSTPLSPKAIPDHDNWRWLVRAGLLEGVGSRGLLN